jgi:catechol 2,3-dioxygenase-like lactoylglutathione lyase family enzyme
MSQSIATLALVVRNYDEAIAWFSRCLGFELVEDLDMGGAKRWVVMRGPAAGEGSWRATGSGHRQSDGRTRLPVPGDG